MPSFAVLVGLFPDKCIQLGHGRIQGLEGAGQARLIEPFLKPAGPARVVEDDGPISGFTLPDSAPGGSCRRGLHPRAERRKRPETRSPTAIMAVKNKLDECDRAMRQRRRRDDYMKSDVPTTDEYATALRMVSGDQ